MDYDYTTWKCKTCPGGFSSPINRNDKIVTHINSKKHKKYQYACPVCHSLKMVDIKNECWDRDGMREAVKCARCKTEYKSFAHGIHEKNADEYTGEKPDRIKKEEIDAFHKLALSRGYVRA